MRVGPCLIVLVQITHDFDFDPERNRSYGSGIMVVVMMMVVVVVKLCTPIHWTFLLKDESRLGLKDDRAQIEVGVASIRKMRTNLRPHERSTARCMCCVYLRTLFISRQSLAMQMNKERLRKEIRISRSRHKASCTCITAGTNRNQ